MTIQIHRPELEALINERMKTGAFEDVEDLLMHVLHYSPFPAPAITGTTGADLVVAMQASPYRNIELGVDRLPMPVRRIYLVSLPQSVPVALDFALRNQRPEVRILSGVLKNQ